MLSAAGGCELSNTTHVKTIWKKFKELLPVLSSHNLSVKTWLCVQLLCAERNSPCWWDLAIDKTSNIWGGMTGQWSDRSAMSGRKTLSPAGPKSYLCSLAFRIWTSFWKREGSAGMDMWKAPTVQLFTYRLRESVGLGGPRWHGSSWQRDCRQWKLSVINPHDRHTWRPGVGSVIRAANQLSGRAHWCGCCPCNCTLIKNPIRIMLWTERVWGEYLMIILGYFFLFLHKKKQKQTYVVMAVRLESLSYTKTAVISQCNAYKVSRWSVNISYQI